MMKTILLIILLTFIPVHLFAKTLVLIHGYMEDAMTWKNKGVTMPLLQNNWLDGGVLTIRANGIQKYALSNTLPLKRDVFYTVELPWSSSIEQQAVILNKYLSYIYANRPQAITLVGHSNGGLVARYALVAYTHLPVNALITIATPHLGSPIANLADLANKTPLNELGQSVGHTALDTSTNLFKELRPAQPYNFLYWLNHQAHPAIAYFSIIRRNARLFPHKFDYVVPPYSQNMNKVFALRDKSATFLVNEGHSLNKTDGKLITQFITQIN